MKLTLSIEFGNDAMQEPADAAPDLVHVASQLEDGYTSGYIADANGNRVGYWEIS